MSGDDQVLSLPGLLPNDFTTKHYAGTIPVDSIHHGELFYWLFEAKESPGTAPLVIW